MPNDPAECWLRVLIVDDEPDAADSLALLVQAWGHEVRVAYDGAAALKIALTFQPAVLLLDLAMPGLDGYHLAQEVRRQPSLKAATLIAVTGYADPAHYRRAQIADFDYYLTKPVNLDTLQNLLALVLLSKLGRYLTCCAV